MVVRPRNSILVKNLAVVSRRAYLEKEKTPVLMKVLIESFMGLVVGVRPKDWPKTVNLCATYSMPGERAICIWEAYKAETLENMFRRHKPKSAKEDHNPRGRKSAGSICSRGRKEDNQP